MAMKVLSVFAALAATATAVIMEGEKLPDAELHFGFPPEKIDLASRIAGKNVILLSLPGAFTPT